MSAWLGRAALATKAPSLHLTNSHRDNPGRPATGGSLLLYLGAAPGMRAVSSEASPITQCPVWLASPDACSQRVYWLGLALKRPQAACRSCSCTAGPMPVDRQGCCSTCGEWHRRVGGSTLHAPTSWPTACQSFPNRCRPVSKAASSAVVHRRGAAATTRSSALPHTPDGCSPSLLPLSGASISSKVRASVDHILSSAACCTDSEDIMACLAGSGRP